MQKDRRNFMKFALSLPICIPFAYLQGNRAPICKDEVEYGDWKTYGVDITREFTGSDIVKAQEIWESMVRKKHEQFKRNMNEILFRIEEDTWATQ